MNTAAIQSNLNTPIAPSYHPLSVHQYVLKEILKNTMELLKHSSAKSDRVMENNTFFI